MRNNFTGRIPGQTIFDFYKTVYPWARIPEAIIDKILKRNQEREGFDYLPTGPLLTIQGEGGTGTEEDPIRLPEVKVAPKKLTLPIRFPFSPDFIIPRRPIVTAKRGSKLVPKHLQGGWISWLGQEGAKGK